jgi:anti-sigma factor RsiW
MNSNRCKKYEELLARYLHGDILAHERESLDRHLADCPACKTLHRDVAEADRLIRSLPPFDIAPPPWLHARIMANLPEVTRRSLFARWAGWTWSVAATSAAAILAVLLVRGGAPPSPARTASAPSPPAATVQEQVPPVPVRGTAGPAPAPRPERLASHVPEPRPEAAEPKVRVIHEVRIYLYAPTAQRVAVTGDFNGWDPKGVDLKPSGKPGMWETDLELTPGAYAYNFIVDGDALVPDPDSPNQMPDGFGGTNSILLVKEGAPA